MIGKLEELVLLSVIKTGKQAVPSAAYEHFANASKGRKIASFGAFYTTLERLSKKGLLDMTLIDEGGKNRKSYTINNNGRHAVSQAVDYSYSLGGMAVLGR